jgi:tRNA-splicing ligase RtcB
MADGHLGYAVPIGGVVAYKDAVSPSGVGYDIACGNKAVKTNLLASELATWPSPVKSDKKWIDYAMDTIWKNISFGMGRNNDERIDHDLFDDLAWQIKPIKHLRDKAANQLGTVGGGNHYVDLFVDEEGWLWIGVHFGSRGLGHDIAKHYLQAGGAKDGMNVEPLVLGTDSLLGQEYLMGMRLAGRYAYAGRDWVCAKVARLLGAEIVEEVHNHHNYAWFEEHKGLGNVCVVRKGATPAWTGQRGFVGGSMGDDAVIVEGVAVPESEPTSSAVGDNDLALWSTVHGAGRAMSRTAAKGKTNRKTGEVKSQGAISRDMMLEWVRGRGVELRGADVDEAPQAYKRLDQVLVHHAATIRVLHTLKPIGVAMASGNTRDPYRD